MIALLVGSAVLLFCWGCWHLYWRRRQHEAARRRIRAGLGMAEPPADPVTRLRQAVDGLAVARSMERQLVQANIAIAPADFFLVQVVAAILLALLLARALQFPFVFGLGLSAALVMAGVQMVIRLRKGSLAQAVSAQLPDTVRMLANALHAGLSIRQGLAMVARETPAPLGPQLQRTVHEIHLGAPLEEALDGLAGRIDSPDLRFVITTILLQHEVGGDLAGALESVAAALVERMTVEGEVRTVTAEQRYVAMLLPVVPVMGVLILNAGHPGYARVLTKPLGVVLLIISGLLQGLGFFLIARTARIRV